MKPFNLELAKAGCPVCTSDGNHVKLFDLNYRHHDGKYTIAGIIRYKDYDSFATWTTKGKYYTNTNSDKDLFMVTQKKSVWKNFYKNKDTEEIIMGHNNYKSEEETIYRACDCIDTKSEYICTKLIEWEEY